MDIQERNKKVEENLALVTFSLNKLGVGYNEDYFQQGVLELIRCVECFDKERGKAFSTYAVKNITLKLKEYISRDRVLKPKRTGVGGQVYAPMCDSFEKVVFSESGKEITLGDTIMDKNVSTMSIDLQLDLDLLVDSGRVNKKKLEILLKYCLDGKSQRQLAKEYKLSQAQISRIIDSTRNKLKKYLSYNIE